MTQPRNIPDEGNWAWRPPAERLPEVRPLKLPDGYVTELYVYRPPAGAPQHELPVIYIHGVQSHPRWYARSAVALADAGHVVYQPSRRGCGRNTEARGVASSPDQLFADVEALLDVVRAETGAERVHFVAVSWGGKFLAACLSRRPRLAAAAESLTLVAPGIVPQVKPPMGIRFGQGWLLRAEVGYPLLAAVLAVVALAAMPCHHGLRCLGITGALVFLILMFVNRLVRHVLARRMYPVPLGSADTFTDNPVLQRYLDEDTDSVRTVIGHFSVASWYMDRMVRRGRRGSLPMPTTLILARGDRIIRNDATRRLVERLTDGRADVVELDGGHTLEFGEDPTTFLSALVASMRTANQGGDA